MPVGVEPNRGGGGGTVTPPIDVPHNTWLGRGLALDGVTYYGLARTTDDGFGTDMVQLGDPVAPWVTVSCDYLNGGNAYFGAPDYSAMAAFLAIGHAGFGDIFVEGYWSINAGTVEFFASAQDSVGIVKTWQYGTTVGNGITYESISQSTTDPDGTGGDNITRSGTGPVKDGIAGLAMGGGRGSRDGLGFILVKGDPEGVEAASLGCLAWDITGQVLYVKTADNLAPTGWSLYAPPSGAVRTQVPLDADHVDEWMFQEAAPLAPFATNFVSSVAGGSLLNTYEGSGILRFRSRGIVSRYAASLASRDVNTILVHGAASAAYSSASMPSASIDTWVNWSSSSGFGTVFRKEYFTVGNWGAPYLAGLGMMVLADGSLYYELVRGGAQTYGQISGAAVTKNQWCHLGLTYNAASGDIFGYVNGKCVGTVNVGAGAIDWGAGHLVVGAAHVGAPADVFRGQINALRVSRSVRDISYFEDSYAAGNAQPA